MASYHWLIVLSLFTRVSSLPQKRVLRIPNVDFSSAQEVNNLEPSAIPGIESRSFSSATNGNYVEATVEEVQNILKSNPNLPRLTRGEIIDLIENITREDMEKLRSLNSNRNGKAILLVMPYSPKRNGETMEDLYTKRPVTQLIDTEKSGPEEENERKHKKPISNTNNEIFRRGSVKAGSTSSTTSTTTPAIETTYSSSILTSTVSTTPKITTRRQRTRPPRTRPPTTSKPPTITRPLRRRRTTTTPPTTVTKYPNHRYSDEKTDKFLPENAMRPTRPSVYRISRRTTTQKPDLSFAESYVNNVYLKYDPLHDKNHKTSGTILNQDHIYPNYHVNNSNDDEHEEETISNLAFKPLPIQTENEEENKHVQLDIDEEADEIEKESDETIPNKSLKPFQEKHINYGKNTGLQSMLKPQTEDFMIPENLKYIIKDLELEPTLKKDNVLKDALKSATIFPRTTTTTTTEFPITPMPEFKEVADNLSPEMRNILMTFGLIPSNIEEDKKKELRDSYYPEKAQDHPESYTGFKPLPEEGEPDKDMDALLASFGLGRSARTGKKIKKEVRSEKRMDFSVVPDSMLKILQNLGLTQTSTNSGNIDRNIPNLPTEITKRAGPISRSQDISGNEADLEEALIRRINGFSNEIEGETDVDDFKRKIDYSRLEQEDVNRAEVIKQNSVNKSAADTVTHPDDEKFLVFAESEINTTISNVMTEDTPTTKDTLTSVVFNPTDQKIVQHEKEQLDKLMELVKALKAINGSATEEDFENIDLDTLKHFTEVLNNSQRLTVGEQIGMTEEGSKLASTTTESVTLIIPSETQNELASENLVLEELPGGFQVSEMETESPAAKKLPSGPYYLIDWNSFLEVDDTKGRRVNLRLQPTVGDPNRFYAINNN